MTDKLDAGPYWGNSNLPSNESPARGLDPHATVGWNLRQKEVDELHAQLEQLKQELTATQDMAFDLTERLFNEGTQLERLEAENERLQATADRRLEEIGRLAGRVQQLEDVLSAAGTADSERNAEVEQLRAAAQRVLDGWDDNLPSQEEIEALRQVLGSRLTHNI